MNELGSKSGGGPQPGVRHWDVLMNVRDLLSELEHLDSDFEIIGSLENECLPPQSEYFLSLTVEGNNGPTVAKMGFEGGRLYLLLNEDAQSSQLAVLDLSSEKT